MDRLGIIIKFALVIGVLSLVCLFICAPLTTEFWLAAVSFAISAIIVIVGAIILRKRK